MIDMGKTYRNAGLVILFLVSLFILASCDDEEPIQPVQEGSINYQFELYDADGNPYMIGPLQDGIFSTCFKFFDSEFPTWQDNKLSKVSDNVIGHLSCWWLFSGKKPVNVPFVVKLGLLSDQLLHASGVKYVDVRIGEFEPTVDDQRMFRPVSWESDGLDVLYVKDKKMSPEYIITCIGIRLPVK